MAYYVRDRKPGVILIGSHVTKTSAQLVTGCSVIRCLSNHQRYPDLPVVIVPGNVGDETAPAQVYNILTAEQERQTISRNA